ncbi:MAG: DUF5706 domain-containing protein [Balneolaceae bacterium]|nr:DUF5706 domain-containing protein [Balneolaceae bacterium]
MEKVSESDIQQEQQEEPVSSEAGDQTEEEEQKEERKLGSRKRGVSDMFRTAYRTHIELSSIADNKSNIMISINGIIISICIAELSDEIGANPWLWWPLVTLLVSCLISLVYAVLAARPRVNKNPVSLEDVRANRENILFFGNYNNMERAEFVEGIEELMQDETRLYDSMARDLYGLGKVLFKKYDLLRTAYSVFMIGVTIAVLLFITVYLTMA